ncbi:DUF86 domain-containing protein, partial [Candidatus Symbiothrix dinenymphae]|uniref:HepT-like ribonuclease domain-containing protein n=1 Tax=Candidatus Symbiothrix dinenymphae TaxID=467085 RepID=UPI000AE28C4E
ALQHIEESLLLLVESTEIITTGDDFLTTPSGMLMLDGVYMRLFAIGEEVKNLDKHSNKELLPAYPSIPWRKIMGLRDIIAHHYFEVDANIIFDVLLNEVPPLLDVITKMKRDLAKI